MLAVAAVPAAATPELPMPPGNLSWTWVEAPDDGWWVGLTWEPAASPVPVDHYLLYRLDSTGPQEPIEIDVGETEYVDEATDRLGSYVYFLVAVGADLQSPPSNPAVAGDAFHCDTFRYSIQPPSYTLHPNCLPP